ncbi:transposase [Pollutibacter soli]|uniref:transposase n=1 Tax=Pollutibacter soli TaxID=3034157 RepID=UPI0030138CC3
MIKAFGIAFIISVRKKGMSTLELSTTFTINQKTAWLFKRKIQEAVKSSFTRANNDISETFHINFGGPELETNSRFAGESQTAEIVLSNDKDYMRGFGTIISSQQPNPEDTVTGNRKKSVTKILEKQNENGSQPAKVRQENEKRKSVVILNLKGWIRGIHHHCSGRFAQGYLDEFFYRFNMRNSLKLICDDLIRRLMGG